MFYHGQRNLCRPTRCEFTACVCNDMQMSIDIAHITSNTLLSKIVTDKIKTLKERLIVGAASFRQKENDLTANQYRFDCSKSRTSNFD